MLEKRFLFNVTVTSSKNRSFFQDECKRVLLKMKMDFHSKGEVSEVFADKKCLRAFAQDEDKLILPLQDEGYELLSQSEGQGFLFKKRERFFVLDDRVRGFCS